ncbi:class I SAM-dependent methyltransferase [Coleofasciculus sp. FACHB-SPT36]|uniref:class I SAM-dependent methyltransferase n=1 Tax=Cyanophyceae TaxID=3028117 RepID=UPI00168B50E6|nr:class I SAM-dependent methyltransferase [Coleofasciculus sp. FACHB-SPT36]MBD2540500.1 class I SAM-dependent methyltransferase [Coleofasciculus sp. FACHB-SPT36]
MPISTLIPVSCPVCSKVMIQKIEPWLRYCPSCGLWTSLLTQANYKLNSDTLLVEEKRYTALKPLREYNYEQLLNALCRFMPLEGAKILDVGCAYGWFLQAASARGMLPVGIEPEEEIAAEGLERGFDIRVGYFPECCKAYECFDAIVFNDVLEHLPNIDRVFEQCHALLLPGGKLVVNLPNSKGFFFHLACLLAQLGYKKPLHRLWQKDYRSPHLIYFNSDNLKTYASKYGFKLFHSQSLETVRLQGLWSRLLMDRTASFMPAAIIYGVLLVAYPLLTWLAPPDILLHIYQRQEIV